MINVMHQCVRPACSFRFPGPDENELRCPKCGSTTHITDRIVNMPAARSDLQVNLPDLHVGLDNLRSVLNVGSIFRSADGAGVNHIHLFGITPPPTHPKMQKTALGASDLLPWTQHWDGVAAVKELKAAGRKIWCLEYSPDSQDIRIKIPSIEPMPVLLIVGNENNGIDPQILSLADKTFHLPMVGSKESLNVANAFAIAVYWLQFIQGQS